MGKKFYGILIGIFIIISIVLGVFSYSEAQKISMLRKEVAEFPWVVPMDEEYIYFYGNDDEIDLFIGYDKKNKAILLDEKGVIIEKQGAVLLQNGFYAFMKDRKYGIKDRYGKVVIPAAFKTGIYQFNGKYGRVSAENNYESDPIIDSTGEIISRDSEVSHLNADLFEGTTGDSVQIVDIAKDQEVFITNKYSEVYYVGENHYTGTLKKEIDIKGIGPKRAYSFFDKEFKLEFGNRKFVNTGQFRQGLCYVEEIIDNREIVRGYINTNGEMVIKTGRSKKGFAFSEEKAFVHYKGKVCCIDKAGRTLFEIPIDRDADETDEIVFHNGVAVINDYVKSGVVNTDGNWVIRPGAKYNIYFVNQNLLSVGYGSKVGVVRIGGQTGC